MTTNHGGATENDSVEKVEDLFNSLLWLESLMPEVESVESVEKVAGLFNKHDVFAAQDRGRVDGTNRLTNV